MTRRKKWLITSIVIIFVIMPILGISVIELMKPWVECTAFGQTNTDYNYRIGECSIAIKVTPKFSLLYKARGGQYLANREYELAIKDFDQAIKFDPEDFSVYAMRGLAYLNVPEISLAKKDVVIALEKFDPTIKNFDQLIESDPLNMGAYTTRGLIYLDAGNHDAAEKDIETALQVFPKDGALQKDRVVFLQLLQRMHFLRGDFSLALKDDKQLRNTNPQDANFVIWQHIDSLLVGQDDLEEFKANIAQSKPTTWESDVLNFFDNKISPEDLLEHAYNSDLQGQNQQLCEANFYIGEALLSSNIQNANKYFKADLKVCFSSFYDFASAAELRRIHLSKLAQTK